jgi:hypothetical protein
MQDSGFHTQKKRCFNYLFIYRDVDVDYNVNPLAIFNCCKTYLE